MTLKIKLISVLALLMVTGFASAQVTVFPECNFLGEAKVLPVGNYGRAELIRRGVGDNTISSIIVSDGFEAVLYEDDGFRGRSGTATQLTQCLDADNFSDNVSSIKVQPAGQGGLFTPSAGNESAGQFVEIFSECYYKGRAAQLTAGEYAAGKLANIGMPDNSISSIKVPKGFEITLYHNDFYRGHSGKLSGDNECLVKRFNDQVSSVKVTGQAEGGDFLGTSTGSGEPVVVYTECDFQGRSATLQAGEYSADDLKSMGIPDNSIASFRVPAGAELQIFFNDFQRGVSTGSSESARCLEGGRFDAQISSVKVIQSGFGTSSSGLDSNANSLAAVRLFTDCEFRGNTAELAVGEYKLNDLTQLGISDNDISAMQIAEGYQVKVYDNDFFRGGTLTLTASESCLAKQRADNAISSLIVEKIEAEAPPSVAVTATEKQQLTNGLLCVKSYVEKDLCTADAWKVMSNFCQLEDVPLMSDGYLQGHVDKGNCTTKNWEELVRRISEPDLR